MSTSLISHLVGSSRYQAIADDALKDEDTAAWVMSLEPDIRQEWLECISTIRLIDRLAENHLLEPGNQEFQKFYRGWQHLLTTGQIKPDCAFSEILARFRDRWNSDPFNPTHGLTLRAWNRYFNATRHYHQPDLILPSVQSYTTMLGNLSGSCFQVLPFLPLKYWQAAYYLGSLDQFFNHIRDLQEDAHQKICYLPAELLDAFRVSRDEILQLSAPQSSNYIRLMQFWMDHYLPLLQVKIRPLIQAQDLPPSWRIWRDWSLQRYSRIETVFRECNFDYTRFPNVYWVEVQQTLPLLLEQLERESPCNSPKIAAGRLKEPLDCLMVSLSQGASEIATPLLNILRQAQLSQESLVKQS